MFTRVPLALLLLLALTSPAIAQQCPGVPAGRQIVYGRLIVPLPNLDDNVEMLLFHPSQEYVYTYTKLGQYRFPAIDPGRYELVVRIEGFKEHREKIDACDVNGLNIFNIFLNLADQEIPFLVADFSKELSEAVDPVELGGAYPKPIVDEFKKSQDDRHSGFFKTAEERLQRLVTTVPQFYEAHMLLGSNYMDRKSYRQAEAEFNTAMDLRPTSAAPLLALGSLYLVEVHAAINPDPGEVGLVLAAENIPLILDDARDVLEKAVKMKPDAAFAHYLLGVTSHRSSAYGRAEVSFKRALELDAKLRWTRIALANLYLRLGKFSDVVEQLDAYLKDFPDVQNRFEVKEMRDRVVRLLERQQK